MTARRRVGLIVTVAAAAVVAVALVLLLRGGDEPDRPPAPRPVPLADPLAFVPADRAGVVLDLDTRDPLIALAVRQVLPRLTGGALSASQVGPLLGDRAAVALADDGAYLAFATRAAAPRPARGVAGHRPGVVVVAPSAGALRRSLVETPGARRSFDARFAGLPSSRVRVAFHPQPLLEQSSPEIAGTRWGRSLRDGVAVLISGDGGLRMPFRISAEPVRPSDLPVASGAAVPRARGSAPVVVGLRDPAQTVRFAREAGLLTQLDLVDRLPGFLRPDLNDLGPGGTLTTGSLGSGLLTLRSEPRDPGDWESKLGRVDTLSELVRRSGLADLEVSEQDEAYTLMQGGQLVARAGVYGRALVISDDPAVRPRAAAAAPPSPAPPGAEGGLTLRMSPDALGDLVPSLLRAQVGDVTGWARFEPAGVSGELQLGTR